VDTVDDSTKRVNFQRAFIKLLQDVKSVLLYKKVRRPTLFNIVLIWRLRIDRLQYINGQIMMLYRFGQTFDMFLI
jgi:hypothetical protein